MSFLTALMFGAGGYGQGRQERTQNQQTQEQIDQSQQQVDIEQQKWREMQRQILQNQGINPATNQPYQMPQNLTNATGGQPNHGKASLQQLVDWHMQRAKYFRQTGQTDSAADEVNYANNLQGIQGQQMTFQNSLQRSLMLRNMPTWAQQQLFGYDQSQGFPYGMRPSFDDYWNLQHGLTPYFRPQATTPEITNEGKLVSQYNSDAGGSWNDYQRALESAKVVPKDADGDPIYNSQTQQEVGAPLTPDRRQQLDDLTGELDQAPDPKKYAEVYLQARGIANVPPPAKGQAPSPDYVFAHLVRLYATYAVSIRRRNTERQKDEQLLRKQLNDQQQPGGGSYGYGNPTPGGQVPPSTIWDMLVANGASPQEATTLTAVAYAESGGNPTSVNPKDNGGKQTSWGLFQISDGTHNEPPGWNDPAINTQMAIRKLRTQGLHAWGTYNTGAYRQYLPAGVQQ